MGGGILPVKEKEFAPGKKIHSLGAFALSTLGEQYEELQDASFNSVISAKKQVVAGISYRVEGDTTAGVLRLVVWEQVWTNMLRITEATLLTPSGKFLPLHLCDASSLAPLQLLRIRFTP